MTRVRLNGTLNRTRRSCGSELRASCHKVVRAKIAGDPAGGFVRGNSGSQRITAQELPRCLQKCGGAWKDLEVSSPAGQAIKLSINTDRSPQQAAI